MRNRKNVFHFFNNIIFYYIKIYWNPRLRLNSGEKHKSSGKFLENFGRMKISKGYQQGWINNKNLGSKFTHISETKIISDLKVLLHVLKYRFMLKSDFNSPIKCVI